MSPAEPSVTSGAPEVQAEAEGSGLFSLKGRTGGRVVLLPRTTRGCGEDRLFSEAHSDITKRQQMQVVTPKNFTRCKKKKFTMRVVKQWSRGPEGPSLLPWRQSKLDKTRPWANPSSWTYFEYEAGSDDVPEVPPTWTVPWFCDIATNSWLSIDRISQYYSVRAIYKAFCHRSICLHTID